MGVVLLEPQWASSPSSSPGGLNHGHGGGAEGWTAGLKGKVAARAMTGSLSSRAPSQQQVSSTASKSTLETHRKRRAIRG